MSRGAERMPCWVNFGNLQPFRAETRRKLHKYAKETDAAASVSYCIPKTTRWASGSKEAAADEEK